MEISCVAQCSNIDEEYLQNPEEQTEAVIIDVETQLYETKQVADAETQVETLSKSIGTQTLAVQKPKKSVLSTTPSIVQVGSQQQADDFDHLIDNNYPVSFVFPASPSSPTPQKTLKSLKPRVLNTIYCRDKHIQHSI